MQSLMNGSMYPSGYGGSMGYGGYSPAMSMFGDFGGMGGDPFLPSDPSYGGDWGGWGGGTIFGGIGGGSIPIPAPSGGGGGGSNGGSNSNSGSIDWTKLLTAGGGIALAALLGGNGGQIQPQVAPDKFPDLKAQLNTMLKGQFDPATGQMKGMPQYPGQITTPATDLQQKAWNSWQPWDGGTQYLANYITNGSGPSSQIQNSVNNMQNYGVQGGYPGDLMHSMAQFGSAGQYPGNMMNQVAATGGVGGDPTQRMTNLADWGFTGNNAVGGTGLKNAVTWGGPSSQINYYMQNLANNGVASQGSGGQLQSRANGGQNTAMSYLAPFLQHAAQQQGPTPINFRQTYRNPRG